MIDVDDIFGVGFAALITLFVCGYALIGLIRLLQRSRPDLALGRQVAVGFAVRFMAAVAVSLTSLEGALRGGDEGAFLSSANRIADSAFASAPWTDALTLDLHEFVFATQLALFDSPDLVLRITQVTIAMAGLILLAAAVYELAGARAAKIAMWILVLEPSGVFFSSILHKEPLMLLAGGLVAFGAAMLWKRAEPRWFMVVAVGCAIAVATRPYAGWFLIAASAAVALHSGLRRPHRGSSSAAILIGTVVLLGAVAAPTILGASTGASLEENLQRSQEANASDDSNLGLERVDFSTREAIVLNLPGRVVDLLTRPYAWQLGNVSQQLGAIGALVALAILVLLIVQITRYRGSIRAGPDIHRGRPCDRLLAERGQCGYGVPVPNPHPRRRDRGVCRSGLLEPERG